VKTGAPLGPPIISKIGAGSFALSRDAKRLVTISPSDVIQVWDCASGQPVTAPLQSGTGPGFPRSASFSPDGTHLLINSDYSVQIVDLAPAADPPAWFADFIEAASFSRLNDLGVVESVAPEKILEIQQQRLASALNDPWEIFGRWLFSDPTSRTVTPWSTMLVPDYVQKLIDLNQPETLKLAIALSYGHPDWQEKARAALQKNWPGTQ
jgi:hypothetical protein